MHAPALVGQSVPSPPHSWGRSFCSNCTPVFPAFQIAAGFLPIATHLYAPNYLSIECPDAPVFRSNARLCIAFSYIVRVPIQWASKVFPLLTPLWYPNALGLPSHQYPRLHTCLPLLLPINLTLVPLALMHTPAPGIHHRTAFLLRQDLSGSKSRLLPPFPIVASRVRRHPPLGGNNICVWMWL